MDGEKRRHPGGTCSRVIITNTIQLSASISTARVVKVTPQGYTQTMRSFSFLWYAQHKLTLHKLSRAEIPLATGAEKVLFSLSPNPAIAHPAY